jgi:hypothetical protein
MDIYRHRATPMHGITNKQQKPAEGPNLIKLLLAILSSNVNAIALNQKRHQRFAVPAATSLHAANFVKKRR